MPDSKSALPPDRSQDKERGTTRRTFLKSAGLASASVAGLNLLEDVSYAQGNGSGGSTVGPGAVPLRLQINGKPHMVNVEPRATLAEVLRDELHMTGTKIVCDRGSCSACTIWIDKTHGKLRPAQYHPSAGWLKEHGYAPELAKCVHIPVAADFASVSHQRVQPWSVMHELAHAYHDQVLGFDHAEIHAAWARFRDSGKYKSVLHINGKKTSHYGLTNPKEFFAEMTESYFGHNDFFPFNRAVAGKAHLHCIFYCLFIQSRQGLACHQRAN